MLKTRWVSVVHQAGRPMKPRTLVMFPEGEDEEVEAAEEEEDAEAEEEASLVLTRRAITRRRIFGAWNDRSVGIALPSTL